MVAFVERDKVDEFAAEVENSYREATGIQPAIYISLGDIPERVIGHGDELDGREVHGVALSSEGLSGGSIAFFVSCDTL